MCLVLQSRKFVSARPCISSGASCLTLSKWIQAIEQARWTASQTVPCICHIAQCCLHLPANRVVWQSSAMRHQVIKFWAVQLLCYFKHSCLCPFTWQVITSCRLCVCRISHLNSGWVGKVYKGAETWAQTGHRSGVQVQSDLVHAAMFECVTPACMCDAMQCQVLL